MQSIILKKMSIGLVSAVVLYCCTGTAAFASNGVCSAGTGIPPFLTAGVDHNLLLMIDNSASMYDLAYSDQNVYCYNDKGDEIDCIEPDKGSYKQCFDETYVPAATYAGYFERDVWYAYEGEQFERKTDAEATALCEVASHRRTVDGANNICLKLNGSTFESLSAKGNFLNWVAASKLDIQKKILTGGKYDALTGELIMESRGCLERRFIKKTAFDVGGGHLTLAVRPPNDSEQGSATRIEIFPVTAEGYDHGACQQAVDEMRQGSPSLGQLKGYIDDCMGYDSGGGNTPEKASQSAFNHSVQDCWYLAKHGEWTPGGGSVTRVKNDCSRVYDAILPPYIKTDHNGYVCFGDYSKPLTASLYERGYVGRCWDYDGTGVAEVCVPRECSPDTETGNPRCIGGFEYQCNSHYNRGQDTCRDDDWVLVKDCTGGGEAGVVGWMTDQCVDQGLRDYCGTMNFPEVVDPSGQVGTSVETTGDFWNLPAMLIDSGVSGQLGEPLKVLVGHVAQAGVPKGVIQNVVNDLRIGVMIFNEDGAKSECLEDDPYVTYNCANEAIRDGGRILTEIGQGAAHTAKLIDDINNIVANTWTPLGEAMFNAIGYYTQRSDMQLDLADFSIGAAHDPVTDWCQNNNILIITDGASTADRNKEVQDFTKTVEVGGTGVQCDPLHGSTYFADLTKYGWQGDSIYGTVNSTMQSDDGELEKKQNIRTYIIQTGNTTQTIDTIDNIDCEPRVHMEKAAQGGGTTLLTGENPDELEASLMTAFADILSRASAGSAASVISSARSGEGAIYQAIFWPKLEREGSANTVEWVGDVHGLFIDENGFMYEDTNQNRIFDFGPDVEEGDKDKRVVLYYDVFAGRSMACYGQLTVTYDEDGNKNATLCDEIPKELDEVQFIWSANDWLEELFVGIQSNRDIKDDGNFNFDGNDILPKRYIFTWVDLDNDGVVDYPDEIIAMEEPIGGEWGSLESIANNFQVANGAELNRLIKWVRGEDTSAASAIANGLLSEELRSRQTVRSDGITSMTWRLGDVINSTPVTVSAPAEGYHLLYNDVSYARFVAQYKNRRHVVYFGGNDGMLHAVNAGFFSETEEGLKKFCLSPLVDGKCPTEDTANVPALGAELWAYVPYNLQPHLKCLTNPEYAHKYFVDLKPRVFDAQIFASDQDHPDGWGTILVGGMRFGGAPVTVPYQNDIGGTEYKPFISSYFILDITNPEKPPVLLAELTQKFNDPADPNSGYEFVDLGYTTVNPTMAITKIDTTNEWYLVLGSGPRGGDGLKGVSDQQAKVAVFPLHDLVAKGLTGKNKPVKAFRIPKQTPTSADPGTFFLPDGIEDPTAPNGFVSDLITVDFDINPSATGQYISDVVYFGTVEGAFNNGLETPAYWQGGGRLSRLVMNPDGHVIGSEDIRTPDTWGISTLIDLSDNTGQAITAAPSVGTDGYNYWIYFGTGRFFDADDRTDSQQQSYYGIKEPMESLINAEGFYHRKFNWHEVAKNGVSTNLAGTKGLLQVDAILVPESGSGATAQLACRNDAGGLVLGGDYSCLPTGLNTADTAFFNNLETYIAGSGDCTDSSYNNCVDGWYKDFFPYENRERNLGQATLLGGLVTFTTYQPYTDLCKAEGESYMYGVYYKTGTSWYKNIFGRYGIEYGDYVRNKLELGRGLAITPNLFTGAGVDGVKVFVQTSTGEILEIEQENLPIGNYKTGRESWREFQP